MKFDEKQPTPASRSHARRFGPELKFELKRARLKSPKDRSCRADVRAARPALTPELRRAHDPRRGVLSRGQTAGRLHFSSNVGPNLS